MVVLNKIYTRTGDAGTTALGTGERVPKHSPRIAAYGTVDETNAAIGMARIHLAAAHPDVDAMLGRIQNDLFDLGADLCAPERGKRAAKRERLRVSDAQIEAPGSRNRHHERGADSAALVCAAGGLCCCGGAARGTHGLPPC